MSLILRFRQHLSQTSTRLSLISRIGSYRSFSQPAKIEDEEEEIDQRKLPTDYDPATFDPTEHRSPPTEGVFKLVDEISSLTLLEISELSAIIMKKKGMTELPTVAVVKPGVAGAGIASQSGGGGGGNEEAKVEKTVFELKLESFEASAKIKIVKELRSFTDLGLKEAKELVEKSPVVLKAGLSKEDGEKILEKLKALGAKAVLE
ncbi:Large ribosomal subunit protein bL12c [Cardamine amara subsp. amara]|uniref:Large ribosomal subunit protein bL12c n=1 Tax=Cardamine amara subsp. amara TaxID=228776 RepID=A0ABD1BFN5_CARAN